MNEKLLVLDRLFYTRHCARFFAWIALLSWKHSARLVPFSGILQRIKLRHWEAG